MRDCAIFCFPARFDFGVQEMMNETGNNAGDDSGILQLGSSASFSDELRRSTVAETEEIAKASEQLSHGITLEEKIQSQAEKDRSNSAKEMQSHISSEKEALERLTMDNGVVDGLITTLNTELLMQAIDSEGTRKGRSFPTKLSALSTRKRVESLRDQIDDIQKSLICQAEAVLSLKEEAEKMESSTAIAGLEESLQTSISSTTTKLEILEEVKARYNSLRSKTRSAEKRLEQTEKELSDSVCLLSNFAQSPSVPPHQYFDFIYCSVHNCCQNRRKPMQN